MKIIKVATVQVSFGVVLLSAVWTHTASAQGPACPADIWQLLQQGGNWIVLRHPDSATAEPKQATNCPQRDKLTKLGIDQARKIGTMFKQKQVPISIIFTSRFCSPAEAAKIIATNMEPQSPRLHETSELGIVDGRNLRQEAAVKFLDATIKTPVPVNDNKLVITHSPTIISALNLTSIEQGEIVIAPTACSAQNKIVRLKL
jgi:phosphohistidine phosphatase SixA